MVLIDHLNSRRRFLLAYALIVVAGVSAALWIWPEQRWGILATGFLGWMAAWFLSAVCMHSIRHRVHALRETAEAIGGGDLSRHIEALPHDDFIKLADTLEHLADQLRCTTREQDRLRQQLTRSEKLALLGELAAIVAHEVNNPLDGLQDSVRILRRNPNTSDEMRQLLDLMDAGLYRIEMIVRRLLTMSRDEAVHPVPTRLDEIVDDASLFIQPRLNRHGIEFVRENSDVPMFVRADRTQMAQVFINLMLNASDSMPEGGKLILRSRLDQSKGVVMLDLSDTGRGIDPQHLPHIFEPFYTTKAKGQGTGLGLAIAVRIVEAHKGVIECHSTPGHGTRFHIELPAVVSSIDATVPHRSSDTSAIG